jgi:hypothetical protein
MEPQTRQMLATLCMALSLTLVALGGSDPTGGFHLGTLSFVGLSTIMRPILDTIAVFHDVDGVSYEELGWCINSFILCLFTVPTKPCHFASLVVTPRCYKAGGRSYAQPPSARMMSPCFPFSFPMTEKKER